jgi:hypothetical protein
MECDLYKNTNKRDLGGLIWEIKNLCLDYDIYKIT